MDDSSHSNSDDVIIERKEVMKQVWGGLNKLTPDNLSVVAPRGLGKSALLRAIEENARTNDSAPFKWVIHWKLGHVSPRTDAEFISELSNKLLSEMRTDRSYDRTFDDCLTSGEFQDLKEVTDLLNDSREYVLMLWDGFDKPLKRENITIDLWDQMRNLIDGSKHSIVTATRAPLDTLIPNGDTSEFWNVFQPISIEPFNETELDELLKLYGLELSSGGKKELMNWTGGNPKFVTEFLSLLAKDVPAEPLDNNLVVESAQEFVTKQRRWLRAIWHECSESTQNAYETLVKSKETNKGDIVPEDLDALVARGFAFCQKNKVKPKCHMLREYLNYSSRNTTNLDRFFRDPDDYVSNIGEILQIRLHQIRRFDNDLFRWVEKSIKSISDDPGDCLSFLTKIEDKALQRAINHELGPEQIIDEDLLAYWREASHQHNVVKELSGLKERGEAITLPRDNRALLCGLLELLTGSRERVERKTKSISKDTYVLISSLHALRNRKEHGLSEVVSLDVAVSTMAMCIALLDCLAKELS